MIGGAGPRALSVCLTCRPMATEPLAEGRSTKKDLCQGLRMPGVTYSCVLQVRPSTVMFLARLLQQRREAIGTRAGRRALPPWSQAVPVLR